MTMRPKMESDSTPLARLLALAKPHPRETYHGEPWPVSALWSDLIWVIERLRDSDESARFWKAQAFYWARKHLKRDPWS